MSSDRDEKILKELEYATEHAYKLQLETLQSILDRTATGASYLAPFFLGQGGPTDPDSDSFRRLVPISSYDDYVGPILAMADGDDRPILSVDPLICFFYSSGTSSLKPKLIPYFDSKPLKSSSDFSHQASAAIVRRLFPPRASINKILWFLYAGNVAETKGGVKVMAASAYPFQNRGPSTSRLLAMCVSPQQVILGSDTQQQMYCHLLCGLRKFDSIDGIRAPYAAGLIRAMRLLESKWKQLCQDIENGTVSSEITDVAMREAIKEFLEGPKPDIANRIRTVCEKGEWGGVLMRLWPELRYVSCVTTGSMEQYYPKLKYYAGDNLTLLGGDYFASECSVAINLDRVNPPNLTRYVMLPTAAYFEFLPFDLGDGFVAREAVDLSGVEIGKMYEVIVTTYRGLYRYRLGDIVKVTGFYNSSPQIEYVTRAPKMAGEVLTERELMSAMETFQFLLIDEAGAEVVDYTSVLDTGTSPKHMIIYIEVSELDRSIAFLRKHCSFLEGCLGSIYQAQRASGDLGPLQICVVKPGGFDRLQQAALKNGAPANQYKPPIILRNQGLVDLLRTHVVTIWSD
ncbi:hypothetical protein MRB53_031114 [Persea americana]|uniref:Uncharacterized protein n=1 Tax=Persea americana TaxID=3435 RepID=A0ACC2KNJ3_PERAE|nr:hypothetical protein MRB53_031114 [Persea americana]